MLTRKKNPCSHAAINAKKKKNFDLRKDGIFLRSFILALQ
jgi:hypothetical protein